MSVHDNLSRPPTLYQRKPFNKWRPWPRVFTQALLLTEHLWNSTGKYGRLQNLQQCLCSLFHYQRGGAGSSTTAAPLLRLLLLFHVAYTRSRSHHPSNEYWINLNWKSTNQELTEWKWMVMQNVIWITLNAVCELQKCTENLSFFKSLMSLLSLLSLFLFPQKSNLFCWSDMFNVAGHTAW